MAAGPGHENRLGRPNIVVVFADQLRGSSVGYAGQEPVLTPHLDTIAAAGVRFTRAVANCPLCCPMRASLITGQHPLTHGVVGNDIRLQEDSPGIAKALSQAGYQTAYIGKWHLDGPDRTAFTPPGPRRQGFEYWAACNCNHLYFEAYYYRDTPEPIWIDTYEPHAQTDLAIAYLRAAQGNDPFCLFLSWGPPHCPYDHIPSRFAGMYEPQALTPRPNAPTADRRVLAGYYAHVTALDWNLGRLVRALDETGLTSSTLLIFTSDHGDMLFSHARGWKSKPWAESVLVPFVARWPGVIPAGHAEHAPFGLVDLMPTLCAIAGVPVPPEVEGQAWPQMLLGTPGPRPRSTPIYLMLPAVPQSFPVWRGVVTDRYTYARFADEPWVLYDDYADPYQLQNLVGQALYDEIQSELDGELQAWLARTQDAFAPPEEIIRQYGIETTEQGIPVIVQQPAIVEEQRRRAASRAERMATA